MAVDPRKFLFNSDYPIDMLAWISGVRTAIAGGNNFTNSIWEHKLPFRPLTFGGWSPNESMEPFYAFNTSPLSSSGEPQYSVKADANPTNVKLEFVNRTADLKMIYYVVYAFAPPEYDGDVAPTAISGDPFILNTDYNYTKLAKFDSTRVGANATATVPHGLGFLPQVMVWFLRDGQDYIGLQDNSIVTDDGQYDHIIRADNTNIYIKGDFVPATAYYRIYADEVGVV